VPPWLLSIHHNLSDITEDLLNAGADINLLTVSINLLTVSILWELEHKSFPLIVII
jgi:hypothetical protein